MDSSDNPTMNPQDIPALPDLPCYLNGEFTRLPDAKVSVMDRGFIFADGPRDTILGDTKLLMEHRLEQPLSMLIDRNNRSIVKSKNKNFKSQIPNSK